MRARRRALFGACLALILVVASILRLCRCTAPWGRGHDGCNGAVYSTIARNYLAHGLVATGLLSVVNASTADDRLQFGLHHPPLLGLMVAGSFRLLGESECAARLVPALFSLGVLAMLLLLVAPLWGRGVALLACFFAACMPMDVCYGPQVEVFGSVVLFFILCSYVHYRRWRHAARRIDLCISLAAFLCAICTEWTGYYLLAMVLVEETAGGPGAGGRRVFPLFLVVGAAAFVAYLWAVRATTGAFDGGGWIDQLLFRMDMGGRARHYPFTMRQYMRRVASYLADHFWHAALGLSLLGAIGTFGPAGRRHPGRRVVAMNLLALGWAHPVIFRNAVYLHDYTMYNLTPAVSLLAAVGAGLLWNAVSRRSFPVGVALVGALLALHASAGYSSLVRFHAAAHFPECRRFGGFLRAHTNPGETVLTPLPRMPQYSYYADRTIIFDVLTEEGFAAAAAQPGAAWYAAPARAEREGARRLAERLGLRHRRVCAAPYLLLDLREGRTASP